MSMKLGNEEVHTMVSEIFLSCSSDALESDFLLPETELKQCQEFYTKYGTTFFFVLNSTMIYQVL